MKNEKISGESGIRSVSMPASGMWGKIEFIPVFSRLYEIKDCRSARKLSGAIRFQLSLNR